MNFRRAARAFTLVELLVAISIVSFLSSVVFASLSNAREKGRIGAARYFAAQVDHIAGERSVALYDFNECPGPTALDGSGNGNGASLGGATWDLTDTPTGSGCSLNFSGASQIVSNIGTTYEGTAALWIKLTAVPSNTPAFLNISPQGTNQRFYMQLQANTGRVILAGDATWNVTTYALPVGKWVHLTYVKKSGKQDLYVDGKLFGSYSYPIIAVVTGTLPLGGLGGDTNGYINAKMDGVHIFSKDLTAQEVGRLYAIESARGVFVEDVDFCLKRG